MPSPDTSAVLIIGLSAAATFLLVLRLYPAATISRVRQELSESHGERPPLRAVGLRLAAALVESLGQRNQRFVTPRFRERMKRRFTIIGTPEYRAQDFIAQQQIWAVAFGLLGVAMLSMLGRSLWYGLPFAVLGGLLPHIWLQDQINKRQQRLVRALPYHIDLLTLSVEAGLDFQAALATVVERGQPGPLIEEFSIMLREFRLGKTRAEALKNLAERVRLPDISAFVANLIQAEKMGTSLGKVLRIQSTQMRVNRTHRAEKLANEAPVKMLLPLVGCIFPTVFIVLFGPIVYRLIHGG